MKTSALRSAVRALLVVLSSLPALAQVSNFDTLNGYTAGVENRVAQARSSVLRLGPAESEPNLTVTGSYLSRNLDATGDSIERDTKGDREMVELNWKRGDWSGGFGLAADYTKSDYREINSPAPTPLNGKVRTKAFEGSAWVGVNMGAARLVVVGATGRSSNKGTRISDAGFSRANFDSRDHSLGLQLSYHMTPGENLAVQPFASISTATADADGFTEQGTAPDRRIVRGYSIRETFGAVGARFAGRQGTWNPALTVAWLNQFSDGNMTISSSAINGSNLGSGTVPSASKNLFFIGAGLSGTVAERWLLGLDLQYFIGGQEKQFGVNASLRRTF